MSTIQFVEGDATAPEGAGAKIIVHVCNDVGGWGKGFVVAISKRWTTPEKQFRAWFRGELDAPFALGGAQLVEVGPALWVANVVGQHGLHSERGVPPIRYDAVREGLALVRAHALRERASVHMPRIGCGLAGGNWDQMGPIVETELVSQGVSVTVYDFPAR